MKFIKNKLGKMLKDKDIINCVLYFVLTIIIIIMSCYIAFYFFGLEEKGSGTDNFFIYIIEEIADILSFLGFFSRQQ